MLQVVYAWQNELAKTMNTRSVQNMVRIPVPVAQGSADDYRRSIDLMMQVWERWMPWLAPPALIGLGSVCRRHLTDPRPGLFAILEGLEGHLPPGARLHLFGVKGQALERVKMYDWVASVDSMAADFAARVKARKAGVSNTIAHRICGGRPLDGVGASRLPPAINFGFLRRLQPFYSLRVLRNRGFFHFLHASYLVMRLKIELVTRENAFGAPFQCNPRRTSFNRRCESGPRPPTAASIFPRR